MAIIGESSTVKQALKTITFTGGAGLGAVGNVPIFTVTGRVYLHRITAHCTVDLTGATATLALGTTNQTARFIAATTATDIDVGEWWVDTAPDLGSVDLPDIMQSVLVSENIVGTVAVAAVASGAIVFEVIYEPITSNGALA